MNEQIVINCVINQLPAMQLSINEVPAIDVELTGSPGAQGPAGPAGAGVIAGGNAGQVLAKASNADYDTEWVNQSGGSGVTKGFVVAMAAAL